MRKLRLDGITGKLLAAFSVLLIGTIVCFGVSTSFIVSRHTNASFDSNVDSQTKALDSSIDRYLSTYENLLDTISKTPETVNAVQSVHSYVLETGNDEIPMTPDQNSPAEYELYGRFKQYVTGFSLIKDIFIGTADNGGYMQYPAIPRKPGYDPRKRDWYKRGVESAGAVAYSDIYIATSGDTTVSMIRSVMDSNGNPAGVIGFDLNLSELTDILKNTVIGQNGYLIAIDRTGMVISNPHDASLTGKLISESGIGIFSDLEALSGHPAQFKHDGKMYTTKLYRSADTKLGWGYITVVDTQEFGATARIIKQMLVLLVLVAGLISFLLITILLSRILSPLRQVTDALKNIAQGDGDLTCRLHISSHDEIQELADSFNMTLEKIAKSITGIHTEAAKLSEISENFSASMNETAASINQISSNITSVESEAQTQNDCVRKTSSALDQIVSNIRKLDDMILSQSASLSQSSSAIEEMVSNIHSVSQLADKNTQAAALLRESSEKGDKSINEVNTIVAKIAADSAGLIEASTIIQNIASQTNLLSMNAAIEAAHAGASGKGFAVVADEIRKLAETSALQAKSINNVLKTLKSSIDEVLTFTTGTRKQFAELLTISRNVKDNEDMIKTSLAEQNVAGEQVLQGLSSIRDISATVSGESKNISSASVAIITQMETVSRITTELSSNLKEMSTGTNEINIAMNQINDTSTKNTTSIKELFHEVAKFKIA
jgi:methyl-accepting chemotaxis protein